MVVGASGYWKGELTGDTKCEHATQRDHLTSDEETRGETLDQRMGQYRQLRLFPQSVEESEAQQ